jgi:hypothetical protein
LEKDTDSFFNPNQTSTTAGVSRLRLGVVPKKIETNGEGKENRAVQGRRGRLAVRGSGDGAYPVHIEESWCSCVFLPWARPNSKYKPKSSNEIPRR